jgi:light-regulated signal transduction histidine kinase (bacteriophytochrome)
VGYSQLLKANEGQALTERASRYVDTIIESAISAGTLVDNLLSYSQMGRATLVPVSLDMNALTAEAIRKLDMEAVERTVDWRIGPLPPARGDPTMIRLVLQNLLSNALKFTRGRDPAVIEIGCHAGDAENVYFVRDNGVGFDEAYVSKLFGVFQRLHRVEEFEGTGIGLANVRRIVERHNGRVWAEGKVDGGATISFALPSGTE